jgi:hypothetical protein
VRERVVEALALEAEVDHRRLELTWRHLARHFGNERLEQGHAVAEG